MKGYIRPDGRIGIRNHIAVIYTVECARHVADSIARKAEDAHLFGFPGCFEDRYGSRMLRELATHPNVAGAVVVRLGCESTNVNALVAAIAESGRPVELIAIQEAGGTLASIERGVEAVRRIGRHIAAAKPVAIDWSDLTVGVECGGSDATSGLAANPATGWAVDRIIERGAAVIFSELPELLGCQHYLSTRVADEATRQLLHEGLRRARRLGQRLNAFAISGGNVEGGLTTIEEKSLGALCKAGTKPIRALLKTAEKPSAGAGLYLLDKVGLVEDALVTHYEENDSDGLVALLASGAQLLLFTTGRGSVVGSVVAPVIKICGNPLTSRRMRDNIDLDAGGIIAGTRSVAESGAELVERIRRVADGEPTKAETLGHREYYIPYKPSRACDLG